METNETSGRPKKVFIAAIIILSLTTAITTGLLIHEHQNKVQITAAKEEVDQNYSNLEKDYHDVTGSLDAASLEIGQLKGKNTELDKIIVDKQAMIEQEKKELDEAFSQNKLTQSALNKAHTMISKYESSIAELQKQVTEYAEQNKQLIVKTEELTTDLTCEKEVTAVLSDKNQNLTQKITEASYLQIPAVQVEAVKKNIMGNEVSTSRVRAAESLKISFETGANKALDAGKVSLYVRIINPKGETIAVSEQGSGVIPDTENSKPVRYTKKADISWNQKSRKVVMYWQRYIQDPGTYKVEVYQSGKVVGRGAVKLV